MKTFSNEQKVKFRNFTKLAKKRTDNGWGMAEFESWLTRKALEIGVKIPEYHAWLKSCVRKSKPYATDEYTGMNKTFKGLILQETDWDYTMWIWKKLVRN